MTQQVADDDLASLRAQKDRATAKATAAEKTAETLTGENDKLKQAIGQERTNRIQADELAAVNAIAAAESEAAQAEAAIAAAGAAGDWAGLAKAQRILATAQTRLDQWVSHKGRIETAKKNMIRQAQAQAEAAKNPQPAESGYTPKTQAWLDAHPDVASNEKKMLKAQAAHLEALSDGLEPESDEYFSFVEDRLGLRVKEPIETPAAEGAIEVPEEKPAVVADATSEALPPLRRTPQVNGKQLPAGKMRLTAAEAEAARMSWPDLKPEEAYKEYAKNKVSLQKEGRLQ